MKKTAFLSIAAVTLVAFSGCGDNSKPAAKNNNVSKTVGTYPVAVTQSLKRANTMACSHNLKQLGQALNMFAMDNNRFPQKNGVAGLQELVSQQNYPTSMLCCPAQRPGNLDENSTAFLYLGTLASPGAGNQPVAIEKPGRHGSNTAVLFADGKVKNFTIPGEYTSVAQVIELAAPANLRSKYLEVVKQIEQK